MFCDGFGEEKLRNLLRNSLLVIRQFDWLINSYVLDFYVADHWNKLPLSWRNTFATLSPEVFSELLRGDQRSTVWPLSILCLKSLFKELCIPRNNENEKLDWSNIPLKSCLDRPKLRNIFSKCVKPKKRHEIANMAEVCHKSSRESGTRYVVDFGAGLGHLARVIAYGYGLKIFCLEMQQELNSQAEVIDQQLEVTAAKHLSPEEMSSYRRPIHKTLKLTRDISAEYFLQNLKSAFDIRDERDFSFGIIGLHPCGNLAPILMKLFLDCPEAKFLNLVGCCYMKLTTNESPDEKGYPLSSFLQNSKESFHCLSYESREIACHAIEMYEERLRLGNYDDLRVHSYRAALERIIVRYWPDMKHCGLRSVKHSNSLTFEAYCEKATKNLGKIIPVEDIFSNQTVEDLKKWKQVVIFYTLRLMFAPLIESVILYDRMLCLLENGCCININAIFDPKISPRNHITTAIKR